MRNLILLRPVENSVCWDSNNVVNRWTLITLQFCSFPKQSTKQILIGDLMLNAVFFHNIISSYLEQLFYRMCMKCKLRLRWRFELILTWVHINSLDCARRRDKFSNWWKVGRPYTISPRSSYPIYKVTCYIKWVTTSWTHSRYAWFRTDEITVKVVGKKKYRSRSASASSQDSYSSGSYTGNP